jgi:hypothetical protein
MQRDGVAVSSPVDTYVALGAMLDLVDLVCVGDVIVRRGWATPEQLRDGCAASSERMASRAARAGRYVRAGVDSPMETRLRMLIVLAGLPEPQTNIVLRNDDGSVAAQLDMGYPELKLAIVYDGSQHRENPELWESDIERREGLDRFGWRLVVVTARGVYRVPGRTLDRIEEALRERGAKGLPRVVGDGWRPHFPEWR